MGGVEGEVNPAALMEGSFMEAVEHFAWSDEGAGAATAPAAKRAKKKTIKPSMVDRKEV